MGLTSKQSTTVPYHILIRLFNVYFPMNLVTISVINVWGPLENNTFKGFKYFSDETTTPHFPPASVRTYVCVIRVVRSTNEK
jgi:hypothetical protein